MLLKFRVGKNITLHSGPAVEQNTPILGYVFAGGGHQPSYYTAQHSVTTSGGARLDKVCQGNGHPQ